MAIDLKAVLSKTPKGFKELSNKKWSLFGNPRQKVLELVDGRSSVQSLIEASGLPEPKFMAALEELVGEELIRVIEKQAPTQEAPAQDLDFTRDIHLSIADTQAFRQAMQDFQQPAPAADTLQKEKRQQELAEAKHVLRDEKERQAREAKDKEAHALTERIARMEAEQAAHEAEKQRCKEEQARLAQEQAQVQAEKQAREQAEKRAREEQAHKEQAERTRREQEERGRKEKEAAELRRKEDELRQKEEALKRKEEDLRRKAEDDRRQQEELERRAREEAERQRREKELQEKEAELLRKQEDEDRRQRRLAARAREEAEQREAAEKRAREDAERKVREEEERHQREEEARRQREEEEKRIREEAELKAREEMERLLEQERKAREEAERKAEAERQAREEAERKAETERLAKQEAEKKAREETERKVREEAERKLEEERRAREEAERKAETERQAREEAERRAEQERLAKQEAEMKARQEAERQAREEAERKLEEERRAREEAERRAEQEKQARQEAERQMRERQQQEEEARRQSEAEQRRQHEEAERAKEREEQEKKAAEQQTKKEAERIAKERAEEKLKERERKKEETAEAEPSPAPAKGKWVMYVALAIPLAGVALVAALPLIPLGNQLPKFEAAASTSLGEPVKAGSISLAILPSPSLSLNGVRIGQEGDVQLEKITLRASLGTLTGGGHYDSINIGKATLPVSALPRLAQWLETGKTGKNKVTSLNIDRLELTGQDLPTSQASLTFSPEGALASLQLTTIDKRLKLDYGGGKVSFSARDWTPVSSLPLTFGELDGTATLAGDSLRFEEIRGKIQEGEVRGSARISWGGDWSLRGEVSVGKASLGQATKPGEKTEDKAAKPSDKTGLRGEFSGSFSFAQSAAQPGGLLRPPRVNGSFSMKNGAITNFDLSRIALYEVEAVYAGETPYNELAATIEPAGDRHLIKGLRMSSEEIQAGGQLDVGADNTLTGLIKLQVQQKKKSAKGDYSVSGTLEKPALKKVR